MKIGDKVKVVWNENICSKYSNTYIFNGKTGTISGINYHRVVDVHFNEGEYTIFKEALQLVETNKTNKMKNNLEELEKKYAELGKEIQALKENKVQYPIYCKGKYTGLIVKFDSLKSGIVVKESIEFSVDCYKNNWTPHTDTDTWEQLEVDKITGFYDTQPVWCWDNYYTHSRMLKFYDYKNKCTFCFDDGKRNGAKYNNYLPFEGNWHDWMLEAHKTLEK